MNELFRRYFGLLLVVLLISGIFTSPAAAAGKQFTGSEPKLYATLSGQNEFDPGTDAVLEIVLENQGTDNEALVGSLYAPYQINPTTALKTTVNLLSGDVPATVKTASYMLGDLPAGYSAPARFYVHIDENAPAGDYELNLRTEYSYTFAETMIEPGRRDYIYRDKTVDLNIPVRIKGVVKPEVISVETRNMYPGHTGDIILKIRNAGYGVGLKSSAVLSGVSGHIKPVGGSVCIGDFNPGDVSTLSFKVYVDDSIDSGVYPEEFRIVYTDEFGAEKESVSEKIGVSVGKGAKFRIVSGKSLMRPGETVTVQVEFKNTGDSTAYGAKARIIPVKPFSAATDSALLGDVKPGETASAMFTLSLASDALQIPYGLDTGIKFRDEYDNLVLSDQMMLEIDGVSGNEIVSLVTNPVSIAVIFGIIACAGYYVFTRRKVP